MWDLPRQGLEPVSPLHWQADSQPLRHHGSPKIHLFKVHNSVVFSIFAESQTPYYLSLDPFHHPRKKPCTHELSLLIPPRPSQPVLSFHMDLPILDVSYKWDHTICSLLVSGFFAYYFQELFVL